MRVLVLGGGGFLGSHLCDALIAEGYSVRVYEKTNVDRGNVSHLLHKVEWMEGDFNNKSDMREVVKGVDVIYHLISTTLPKNSIDNPTYDISTNLLPTIHLLDACRESRVKKVIFFSSGGTVYGIPEAIPIDEEHPTNPICSYGIQKLAIEKYLHLYYYLYGIDYAIMRIANPYGERQKPSGAQGVIAVFISKILRGEPIEIWGNGTVVRDYINVTDVAKAALSLLNYEGKYKIFNIGSGTGISLNDLVCELEKVTDSKLSVKYTPGRPMDVPINVLDIKRAVNELLWEPEIEFRNGLMKTVSFFIDN